MKFVADKGAFRNVISVAKDVISNNNATSILSNVLFDVRDGKLTVKAADPAVKMTAVMPVEMESEGTTTVFCSKLHGILGSLPEAPVVFEKSMDSIESVVKPEGKRITFRLKTIKSEKFPDFTDKELEWTEFPANDFLSGVKTVMKSVSADSTRYMMTGVYIEPEDGSVNFVGTDGRRLSMRTMEGKAEFKPVIVPVKIFQLLDKYALREGNVRVAFTDEMMYVQTGDFSFSTGLIKAQYPAYRKVIPESQKYCMKIAVRELLDSLKRVRVMMGKKTGKVVFSVGNNALVLKGATDDGDALEEMSGSYDGEPMEFALNIQYVMDVLDSTDTSCLLMEFSEPMKAVTLRPDREDGTVHVIMPMQI